MKYVRVIDDLGNEYLTTYKEHCEMVAELQDSGFDFEGGIIKQADTIPELCDEFVVLGIYKTNKGIPFGSLSEALDYLDEHRDWTSLTIKGAIWTDKGLIYVADMNDKGGLDLL